MADNNHHPEAPATSPGNYHLSLSQQAGSGSGIGGVGGWHGEDGGDGNFVYNDDNTTSAANVAYTDPRAEGGTRGNEGPAAQSDDDGVLHQGMNALVHAVFLFARAEGLLPEDAVEPERGSDTHAANDGTMTSFSKASHTESNHVAASAEPSRPEPGSDETISEDGTISVSPSAAVSPRSNISDAMEDDDLSDNEELEGSSGDPISHSNQVPPGQGFRELAEQIAQEVRQAAESSGDEDEGNEANNEVSAGDEDAPLPQYDDGDEADDESSDVGENSEAEDGDDIEGDNGPSDDDNEDEQEDENGEERDTSSQSVNDSSDLSELGATPSPPTAELRRIERERQRAGTSDCLCAGWCTCQRYSDFYGEPLPTTGPDGRPYPPVPSQTHLSERVLAAEVYPVSAMRSTQRPGETSDVGPEHPSWARLRKPARPPHGVDEEDWAKIDE